MAAPRLLTGDKGQAPEVDFSLVLQLLLHKLIISNSCNDCYYLTESVFYWKTRTQCRDLSITNSWPVPDTATERGQKPNTLVWLTSVPSRLNILSFSWSPVHTMRLLNLSIAMWPEQSPAKMYPGYQRFFSPWAGIFRVGRRPKPRAAKPREKPLARSGAFYRPRWPLSFFIGLHLRQLGWKSPTVIMWAGTWRNVRRPALSLKFEFKIHCF